jgi:phenylalanine-4-hydroxylase|tara:strand:+ start:105628 stop:106434 length:807 start_codon:yes stop_codon:yes gene_type:complete
MGKATNYTSRQPDEKGYIEWSDDENAIWGELVARQMQCIQGKACDEYLQGLKTLNFPADRIPQIPEVNAILHAETGWELAPVPALINFDKFFALLAAKKFPVATFIRSREEFDYLQEPDIFHEVFGHCAMLTNPDFAAFTHAYGKLGLKANKKDRVWLARLYWFTVEFGLMQTKDGLRIYGGGILSSPAETEYAFASSTPERKPLDVIDVLRTPYRIDIMQPVYFTINGIHDLYNIAQMDIMDKVREAQEKGLHAPQYPSKDDSQKLA